MKPGSASRPDSVADGTVVWATDAARSWASAAGGVTPTISEKTRNETLFSNRRRGKEMVSTGDSYSRYEIDPRAPPFPQVHRHRHRAAPGLPQTRGTTRRTARRPSH